MFLDQPDSPVYLRGRFPKKKDDVDKHVVENRKKVNFYSVWSKEEDSYAFRVVDFILWVIFEWTPYQIKIKGRTVYYHNVGWLKLNTRSNTY
jgi:hypothetical protein